VKGHEWIFMALLSSYLTLFSSVLLLLCSTVHIICFFLRQAFSLKVHNRPAPSENAFYATSLQILERPLAINNHVTHSGFPIPLSTALSLPAYTNFMTAVRKFTDAWMRPRAWRSFTGRTLRASAPRSTRPTTNWRTVWLASTGEARTIS